MYLTTYPSSGTAARTRSICAQTVVMEAFNAHFLAGCRIAWLQFSVLAQYEHNQLMPARILQHIIHLTWLLELVPLVLRPWTRNAFQARFLGRMPIIPNRPCQIYDVQYAVCSIRRNECRVYTESCM